MPLIGQKVVQPQVPRSTKVPESICCNCRVHFTWCESKRQFCYWCEKKSSDKKETK